jgi:hypothetical protein
VQKYPETLFIELTPQVSTSAVDVQSAIHVQSICS